ncbi:glycosyltransferase family 1 protein [Candidatus Parcubacteria bacterium]|nr:MAG: glycosyltransferase family 1 protein [Candidatus Parcubacteria bacterium]
MNLPYLLRRIVHRLQGQVVHLEPNVSPRGNVLISFTTLGYLDRRKVVFGAHTNRWECMQMARTFLERGYAVDVIDSTNTTFVPKKQYAYFIDNDTNMDRIAPLLNTDCVKIYYITHAHWKYQNEAEEKRARAIQEKRGIDVALNRTLHESHAIDLCDIAVTFGGDFAISTYTYAGKKIVRIPNSVTHEFPSPEKKDFEKARHNFIWVGGAGLALKRLDIILEAFAQMPEYRLAVCGKVSLSDPFAQAYAKELYETENIKTYGFVDMETELFKTLCDESLGMVFVSASEGAATSVVVSMHAGLIPIISHEAGVVTGDSGITLEEVSVNTVMNAVRSLSQESEEKLRARAMSVWNYAREHYTREKWAKGFAAFVDSLET